MDQMMFGTTPPIVEAIDSRILFLRKLIKDKTEAINNAPEGSLRISSCRKQPRYFEKLPGEQGSGTYIKRSNMKRARALAQKEYDRKVITAAEKEQKMLYNLSRLYKDTYAEIVLQDYVSPRKELITPLAETEESYATLWLAEKYEGKEFREDSPCFYSDKDEPMRSKSEVLIANLLKKHHIPYKYECPLTLADRVTVYPDFTILDVKNKRQLIWEHLGLLDDHDYRVTAMKKVAHYEQSGIFLGEGLIISYETSRQPLDQKNVEAKIRHYFE